jgi:beta-lactamase regulating signal transducer with metallopeptidase domain
VPKHPRPAKKRTKAKPIEALANQPVRAKPAPTKRAKATPSAPPKQEFTKREGIGSVLSAIWIVTTFILNIVVIVVLILAWA